MIAERISLLEEMSSRGSTSTVGKLSNEILQMSIAQAKNTSKSLEQTSEYLLNQCRLLMDQGRVEEATQIVLALRTLFREFQAGTVSLRLSICLQMAETFFRFGRHAEAEPFYRVVYRWNKQSFPADHEDVLTVMSSLGRSLTEWAWQEQRAGNDEAASLQRAREAEDLLRETLTRRQKGSDLSLRWRVADVQSRLGAAIMVATILDRELDETSRQSRMGEAERCLLDGFRGLEAEPGDERTRYLHDAIERLVRFYDHLNQPAEAETWRKKMEQTKEQ